MCHPGFTGQNCENKYIPCDPSPCLNDGECLEVDALSYKCQCPTGECHVTVSPLLKALQWLSWYLNRLSSVWNVGVFELLLAGMFHFPHSDVLLCFLCAKYVIENLAILLQIESHCQPHSRELCCWWTYTTCCPANWLRSILTKFKYHCWVSLNQLMKK